MTRRDLLRTSAAAALAPALSLPALAQDTRPGLLGPRQIAAAGYIYGLPLVMNYGVMFDQVLDPKSGQWKAPFNTVHNEARLFTWQDSSIVTPNSDTPYSLAWLDLLAEPVVVSVPAVDPTRYVSVQFVDGNTYNYGYAGSRTTGNGAGHYMVVGPRWFGPTPPGIDRVFRSSTFFSLVIFRTQLFDAADLDKVKTVQAGYQARPLSTFLGTGEPKPAEHFRYPAFSKERFDKEFFAYLDFALRAAPPRPEERWIREQLKRIGVGPGRSFRVHEMPVEEQAEILAGLQEGQQRLEEAVAAIGTDVNGWRVGSVFGDAEFYHGDWKLRAAAAKLGIYGNDAAEAVYPATRTDKDGQPLDGAKHRYTLTFAKDALPPVNAFWSVTMYDGTTQLLVKNPIDRYLINSPMLPTLKTNPDGSVTLYIQKDTPGADKESNWLPAPDGPIYLVMRLYWPKTGTPSILPAGKGTWQPPGIVRVA
nr:DUF1254 domain-containing protein [Ancylobacter radicis]